MEIRNKLQQKGVYQKEDIDDWEKLNQTQYSNLNMEHITDAV